MNSTFFIGNNLPENTNVIMGSINGSTFNKVFDELSIEQKNIYNKLIETIGLHTTVNILNFDKDFDCNIIIPFDVEMDIVDIDYESIREIEKESINSFIDMIELLCN